MNCLENYQPTNEQEAIDLKATLRFIQENPDAYDRSNLIAHITASAIIMDSNLEYVLFAHHNLYKSWGWVGGHNDGDRDCLHVAIKEGQEETGVQTLIPFRKDILGIDTILVPNHIKRGHYVPDHLHLNVTYLLIADMKAPLVIRPEENSGVRWFSLLEVFDYVNEERMIPIYKKLFARAQQWKKESSLKL